MSGLAGQFLMMAATSSDEPTAPREQAVNQADTWKFCPVCMEQMPHIRKFDYYECPVCQNRIYPRDTLRYDKTLVPTDKDEDIG